jgi:hypothetical protein
MAAKSTVPLSVRGGEEGREDERVLISSSSKRIVDTASVFFML